MTIEVGDAIEWLRKQDDDSVDAVVTSPPYNIGADYIGSTDKRSDYAEWTAQWVKEAVRVSRNGLMLNIGSKVSSRGALYRALSAITNVAAIQNEIIWVKSITIGEVTYGHFKPVNSARYTNNTHELILHVVKRTVDIDKLAIGVPFTDKSNISRFSGNGGNDLRCRGSVWFVPYPTRTEKLPHPATFPVTLAEMMIKFIAASSVLDPFAGSGSTAVACANLGVGFSGCDISEFYVKLANERIENERRQL